MIKRFLLLGAGICVLLFCRFEILLPFGLAVANDIEDYFMVFLFSVLSLIAFAISALLHRNYRTSFGLTLLFLVFSAYTNSEVLLDESLIHEIAYYDHAARLEGHQLIERIRYVQLAKLPLFCLVTLFLLIYKSRSKRDTSSRN